ncbi:pilus assembly protein [Stieleria sp. JC731]|uniref:TadE/TadG family type IV pilus assembly protein n=1 Tax=Pirellulaceae TaxID=2691357 RepID=UPI001E4E92B4|nr:TadE/TadG family type IV pilus assembly protein [Stieleria sp. JC731]MCC9603941.1 pilus assembly protein [Stieleria sp. JC731]
MPSLIGGPLHSDIQPPAYSHAKSGSRFVNRNRRRRRSGVAAVEFAVCLPVLVLLVFGAIEASSFIFLKQSISVACYEGIREAAKSEGDTADATARAQAILDSRGVNDYTIDFPNGVEGLSRGEQVICQVTAPTNTNSPLAGNWINNRNLTVRVVMLRE